jgi:cysteine desulfurase
MEIYLDNNATTIVDPRVVEVVMAELESGPSNPSSAHTPGRRARARLSAAREQIADYLEVPSKEIFFTSGGTEALNTLIRGARFTGTLVSSKIEHAAVAKSVEALGKEVSYLPVGACGHIDPSDLDPSAGLIALSAANPETGVKNPLEAIGAFAKAHQIPLIVDGVALLGKESFAMPKGPAAMVFSGHKLHAPTGTGVMWISSGFPLSPLLVGGGQESNRRSGTENLVGIIGLSKAIELLHTELPAATSHMSQLRDLLETELLLAFPQLRVNGSGPRLPNTTNISFPDLDGELLLAQLDMAGIAVSMGSACSSGGLEPSHVLLNMGVDPRLARSSLRFSLSRFTTEADIIKTLETLLPLLEITYGNPTTIR